MSKQISIAGTAFELSAPFLAGHILNEAEAKVLNQTRAENIGKNFRADVKKAVEAGDTSAIEAVRAAIAEYDAKYQFSMTQARTPIDPIEAEAQRVAKEKLKVMIAEKTGMTLKAYLAIEGNQDKYDANVEKLAVRDDVLKLAKQRVAAKKKTLEIDSADIDLG